MRVCIHFWDVSSPIKSNFRNEFEILLHDAKKNCTEFSYRQIRIQNPMYVSVRCMHDMDSDKYFKKKTLPFVWQENKISECDGANSFFSFFSFHFRNRIDMALVWDHWLKCDIRVYRICWSFYRFQIELVHEHRTRRNKFIRYSSSFIRWLSVCLLLILEEKKIAFASFPRKPHNWKNCSVAFCAKKKNTSQLLWLFE